MINNYYGADISRWQGTVDWPAFNPGAAFVFIKATGGDNGMYVDSQYIANRDGARSLGNAMPRGYYHFLGLDPVNEANFFCDNVDFQVGEVAMLDEEVPGTINPDSAKQWLDTVSARLGFKPLIYLSDSQILGHDWTEVANAGYGLVVADWAVSPADNAPLQYWPFYAFQQYEDDGHFPGIENGTGNVDADAFFANDITDFFNYGKQADVVAPVSPSVPAPPAAPITTGSPSPTIPTVPTITTPAPVDPIPDPGQGSEQDTNIPPIITTEPAPTGTVVTVPTLPVINPKPGIKTTEFSLASVSAALTYVEGVVRAHSTQVKVISIIVIGVIVTAYIVGRIYLKRHKS